MTNLEKHKNAIRDILLDTLAVTKDGKIRHCLGDNCDSCLFGDDDNCVESINRWLNADCDESKNHMEIATLIAYLKQETNQLKKVKSIKIVDGMPVINGD